MSDLTSFTLPAILRRHKKKVAITWLMIVAENALMVLLPLFIGFAIDSLINGSFVYLYNLSATFALLVIISVARRVYDTRTYGTMRVDVGEAVEAQATKQELSIRNARLDMSRELVDFLEEDLPPLLTAVIQLLASISILIAFDICLGLTAITAGILMLVLYALFHRHFMRLYGSFNNQMEQQVKILSRNSQHHLRRHLQRLKAREVRISDTESIIYGVIFLVLFGFVITNLWLTSYIHTPSSGQIFSIVTYSMEFVESAIMLPIALQALSRLSEISARLTHDQFSDTKPQLAAETGEKTR